MTMITGVLFPAHYCNRFPVCGHYKILSFSSLLCSAAAASGLLNAFCATKSKEEEEESLFWPPQGPCLVARAVILTSRNRFWASLYDGCVCVTTDLGTDPDSASFCTFLMLYTMELRAICPEERGALHHNRAEPFLG